MSTWERFEFMVISRRWNGLFPRKNWPLPYADVFPRDWKEPQTWYVPKHLGDPR